MHWLSKSSYCFSTIIERGPQKRFYFIKIKTKNEKNQTDTQTTRVFNLAGLVRTSSGWFSGNYPFNFGPLVFRQLWHVLEWIFGEVHCATMRSNPKTGFCIISFSRARVTSSGCQWAGLCGTPPPDLRSGAVETWWETWPRVEPTFLSRTSCCGPRFHKPNHKHMFGTKVAHETYINCDFANL